MYVVIIYSISAATILLGVSIVLKSLIQAHRKTVKNLSIHCKRCNRRLAIPHPIDGSRMIVSAAYVKGFEYCSKCLTDHCLDTKCSECKIKDKKNCSFHETKREMMEELIEGSKAVYISTDKVSMKQ